MSASSGVRDRGNGSDNASWGFNSTRTETGSPNRADGEFSVQISACLRGFITGRSLELAVVLAEDARGGT